MKEGLKVHPKEGLKVHPRLEACQKRLAEMEAELAKERRARQEKEGELAEAEKSHKRQKLEADAYSRRPSA